jgi:hypothetical protein
MDGCGPSTGLAPSTLREQLRDWKALFQGKPEQADQLLRKLLDGRLLFRPGPDAEGAFYQFEAKDT